MHEFNVLLGQLGEALRKGGPTAREIVERILNLEGAEITDRVQRAHIVMDRIVNQEGFDADLVRLCLEAGANPNLFYNNSTVPLVWAIENKHDWLAHLLIEAGADVNAFASQYRLGNSQRKSVLVLAIENGLTSVALALIKRNADIHGKSVDSTPLQMAARVGNVEVAKKLVQLGALVNDTAHPQTSLMLAAQLEDNPVLPFLLQNGADVKIEDARGKTALHFAAERNAAENVRLLLEAGADARHVDVVGSTPMIHAAMEICGVRDDRVVPQLITAGDTKNSLDVSLKEAVKRGNMANVRSLWKAGARFSDLSSAQPLKSLASYWRGSYTDRPSTTQQGQSNVEIAQFLWDEGLRPMPSEIETAIEAATLSDHHSLLLWLLQRGGQRPGEKTETALHIAATNGYVGAAKILLEFGYLPNLQSERDGFTPLMCLATTGQVQWFVKGKQAWGASANDAEANDVALAQMLIESGANIAAVSHKGATALSLAVKNSAPAVVEAVLRGGGDPNTITTKGNSLLHELTINSRRRQLMKRFPQWPDFFNRHKADLPEAENKGVIALFSVLEQWDEQIATILIEAGCNASLTNNTYWKPIHYATLFGTPRLFDIIYRADISAQNEGEFLTESLWKNGRTQKLLNSQGFRLEQFPHLREAIESFADGATESVDSSICNISLQKCMNEDATILQKLRNNPYK